MTSIQIRDVPEDLHKQIVDAAASRGLSIQKYLLELLERETSIEKQRQNQQRFVREMVQRPSLNISHEENMRILDEGRQELEERAQRSVDRASEIDS